LWQWIPIEDNNTVKVADKLSIESRITVDREAAKPRRVARRRPQQQQYAAFNPFEAIVSLLTPRDW
jgi:hypothetical protein